MHRHIQIGKSTFHALLALVIFKALPLRRRPFKSTLSRLQALEL